MDKNWFSYPPHASIAPVIPLLPYVSSVRWTKPGGSDSISEPTPVSQAPSDSRAVWTTDLKLSSGLMTSVLPLYWPGS
eukprot:COSAG06_NODE_1715_length_8623_cov_12.480760_5_plen_78_part_00